MVLPPLQSLLDALQDPAEPRRRVTSSAFCCASVYRCSWQSFIDAHRSSTAPNQSAVAALHAGPSSTSPCPSVVQSSSFRVQRGLRFPLRDVCNSGCSSSPLTCFTKLLNFRESGVWFLYQGLAKVLLSCLSSWRYMQNLLILFTFALSLWGCKCTVYLLTAMSAIWAHSQLRHGHFLGQHTRNDQYPLPKISLI